jgi:ATP-dependent RNA helicase RhlE
VGRTARAEAKGDAFLFVAPEEESSLRGIETAIGRRLPRVTLPGFDYSKRPAEKLEVPLATRLATARGRRGHSVRAGARQVARRSGRPHGRGRDRRSY